MTNVHLIWREHTPDKRFRTGVSLHSHTMHSRESLAFLPRYGQKIPVVTQLVRKQEERYAAAHNGNKLDYSKAYWTPPLPSFEALALEKRQIEDKLGLHALVSITDHDAIEACQTLRLTDAHSDTPVSLEWTVPLQPSFVHIGIHNLPPDDAPAIVDRLDAYTRNPESGALRQILSDLNRMPAVLVVLNHPLWDEAKAGLDEHRAMIGRFLDAAGEWIHAFELNGLRPWNENRDVMDLANTHSTPVISGGDRHGTEPNANVNLTNAATFDEFVSEVRRDRMSEVLFMPQYREPIKLRHLETTWDIVRDYPEYPARERLFDRIFWESEPGEARTLSSLVNGVPGVVRYFVTAMRLFNCRSVKSALRAALAGQEEMAL